MQITGSFLFVRTLRTPGNTIPLPHLSSDHIKSNKYQHSILIIEEAGFEESS